MMTRSRGPSWAIGLIRDWEPLREPAFVQYARVLAYDLVVEGQCYDI